SAVEGKPSLRAAPVGGGLPPLFRRSEAVTVAVRCCRVQPSRVGRNAFALGGRILSRLKTALGLVLPSSNGSFGAENAG
ncbi:hypothetical protein, partial [Natrialba sp. PRR66]|uniref:hypothetical protein n=1 Tax=Natrialba sp. PRR66 TaxID=3098146 RepID=UPI002B1D71C1